jgi:DNA mismatch endonuclease (patch repair protein)
MPDVFTKAKRSEVMARIRSRGNKDTELALATLLRRHGIKGWRRQVTLSVGSSRGHEAQTEILRSFRASSRRLLRVKVDFVFPKARLAIFVDGCFWHGCPMHATWPASRAAWWRQKIKGNQARDRLVTRTLRRAGWRVMRIWEHELARRDQVRLALKLERALNPKSEVGRGAHAPRPRFSAPSRKTPAARLFPSASHGLGHPKRWTRGASSHTRGRVCSPIQFFG